MNHLLKKYHPDLLLFISGIALVSFGDSMLNATLNNFLDEAFQISSLDRTLLEFPRELPGFLVAFVSAALFFLRSRRLAVAATCLECVGLALIAFFPSSFHIIFIWIFLYSAGQHLLMPLITSMGMELAREGQDGRRLGQINSIRNMATVAGSFLIFLGFRYFNFNFQTSFLLAAVLYLTASVFFYSMHPGQSHPAKLRLKLHKEYGLYYWLAILFGTRKQLFLTFAPWVLVTVFHKPVAVIATLMTIGGITGIVFQPLLGRAIDHFGERAILMMEAVLLIGVCFFYGFSRDIFAEDIAFIIVAACFVADQLLMSVSMARATYLKKIARHPDHITPTLTMAVTIDHVFSISVALLGGLLWSMVGYQAVFMLGCGIAVVNLLSASRIRLPLKK